MDLESSLDALEHAIAVAESALADAPSQSAYACITRLARLEQRLRTLSASTAVAGADSGLWGVDGYASANAWHRHRTGGDHGASVDAIANGRFLAARPMWAKALAKGEILLAHVSRMRRLLGTDATRIAHFEAVEKDFLVVARELAPAAMAAKVKALFAALDPDADDDDAATDFERREIRLSEIDGGGGWLMSGWLPSDMGAVLAGALNAILDQHRVADALEPVRRRRADALVELAERACMSLPESSRSKARVMVTVPVDAMFAPGNPPRSSDGRLVDIAACWATGNGPGHGRLSPATLRALTCDATVSRLLLGPGSQPLDVGRASYTVPAGMRQALNARDEGCRFPGCDRPPGWTDAHHIIHWADGGSTSIDNLILLCRKHHRVIHHSKRWTIDTHAGRPPEIRRT